MKNGIEIKRTGGGILINGTQFIPDSEAESVVSRYFFPEFWIDRFTNEGDGELCRNSLFLKSTNLPVKSLSDGRVLTDDFTLFTYCNNPKFAAGYLKFNVFQMVLISPYFIYPELLREAYFIAKDRGTRFVDLEEVADRFENSEDIAKQNILDKILHVLRLCNLVFIEKDLEIAKKHLFTAIEKFNEYFNSIPFNVNDKLCSWSFEFKVYDGIENAKSEIFEHLRIDDPDIEEFTSYCIDRKVWGENEKNIIKEAFESIFLR